MKIEKIKNKKKLKNKIKKLKISQCQETREFDIKNKLQKHYIYYKKVSNSLDILSKM